MEESQERVVTERENLDENITRLDSFVSSKAFQVLNQVAQERLTRQLRLMREYSAVLAERIAAF